MRFRFNDKKTAQAAAHLLKLNGGTMNYMQLIKLMYLADRTMLLDHGITITGDIMVSMKNGPVLSRVLDFINHGQDHQQSAWFEFIGPPSNYQVGLRPELRGDPKSDELSSYEMRLLADVHKKFGTMDRWELVNLLHEILPEWSDPGYSSRTIEPVEILRAEDKATDEIEEFKRTAAALWFLDSPAQ